MPRYQADPERRKVADLIKAEIDQARLAEKEGGWITYLIRDPRYADNRGNAAGTPIYVGQSKEFGTRVKSRFEKCEKAATVKDNVERRVADILHAGHVARYEVLERAPTRLSSLISETNWARRCVRRGYKIANQLSLQRNDGPDISRGDVPSSWIWPFLLSEAIEDQVKLSLDCLACGLRLALPLAHFLHLPSPPKTLSHIRTDPVWRTEPCTACSALRSRYVSMII